MAKLALYSENQQFSAVLTLASDGRAQSLAVNNATSRAYVIAISRPGPAGGGPGHRSRHGHRGRFVRPTPPRVGDLAWSARPL